jgi:hypothetical protein
VTAAFAPGDRVTVISVPLGLRDMHELPTRTLFEACVGRSFVVTGAEGDLAQLEVGDVLGEASGTHTLWVERKYLKLSPN